MKLDKKRLQNIILEEINIALKEHELGSEMFQTMSSFGGSKEGTMVHGKGYDMTRYVDEKQDVVTIDSDSAEQPITVPTEAFLDMARKIEQEHVGSFPKTSEGNWTPDIDERPVERPGTPMRGYGKQKR